MRRAGASDTRRSTPRPLRTPPLAYMSITIATTSTTMPAVTCRLKLGSGRRAGTKSINEATVYETIVGSTAEGGAIAQLKQALRNAKAPAPKYATPIRFRATHSGKNAPASQWAAPLDERVSRQPPPAVEFGDEANDVEAQAQVSADARGLGRAQRHHRIEEARRHRAGQRCPVVLDREERARALRREEDADGASRRRKVVGVLHELVEELRNRLGNADARERARRPRVIEAARGIRGAVALDAARHHGAQVEALALGRLQQPLEARGLGKPRDEARQALHALARPLHVDARLIG